jgi:hypothetical protein
MTCGKFSYPSFQEARKVARRQMDMAKRTTGKRVRSIDAYRCAHCNSIHLSGHNELKLKAA